MSAGTETQRPDLLDVCKAQDAVLRDTEALARRWAKSGNPARRADAKELLATVRGTGK